MTASPRESRSRFTLSRQAVRAVDAACVAEFGIPGIVLMENAAISLAAVARDILENASASRDARVLIICGPGNNGGDGFALARHLSNDGYRIQLARLGTPKHDTDAATNWRICRAMKIEECEITSIDSLEPHRNCALIVDALLGTGLDRPVTGLAAEIIQWINRSGCPVLAADVPSGLDCDTGRPLGVAVNATRTVTFVALKEGFLRAESRAWTGQVTVAPIGAPLALIERLGRRTT
jgi:NAD(P)H-hydrate epimerase